MIKATETTGTTTATAIVLPAESPEPPELPPVDDAVADDPDDVVVTLRQRRSGPSLRRRGAHKEPNEAMLTKSLVRANCPLRSSVSYVHVGQWGHAGA
jgi:hypothetical protein